ncbi:MAG: hypothetical protein ABSH34_25375 [Verrucomicrobiota bacterium]|jgi:hypothetical protein
MKDLLPLNQFSEKYGLSRTTIKEYQRLGLPVLQVRRKIFISESAFVEFLQKMSGKTVSALAPAPAFA